ncbi:MAG: argininosuccinate lyase [Pelagibacterales bacterium]|nr:argininosuccinate lyase [Pelagibacterales bacterium]
MAQNKNNKAIWNTRIKKNTSSIFKKVGSSIDVDKRLFKEDIQGSIAHVEMLFKQKIISFKIKNKIIWGLNRIRNEIIKKKFNFNSNLEDIHMNIENRLFEIIGEDAGYIHTGRSRNDQVVTDFKLWLRSSTSEIVNHLNNLVKIIIKDAEKNVETVMPGFTHLKNAQPISFAHYLLAYVEMFKRDKKRFQNNLENLSENPLGAAALAGTSFNIDRNYTSKKLKFKNPTNNSIDTVSDRDFVLDFLYSVSVCSIHISRLAEEFIIWNSDAFRLIKLNDKVVTGSSIMPQKKNPDPLEYLRGKTGSSFGNLFSMLTILKGLPLSYFKDLQDDKELVFNSFDQIKNSILILIEILKNFTPDKKRMYELANIGYTTSTDLADYIVKCYGLPFRKAYQITSKIVNYAESKKIKLNELTLKELKKIEPKLNEDALKVFNLENSIKSKKSYGGTSFENVKKMIKKYKKESK